MKTKTEMIEEIRELVPKLAHQELRTRRWTEGVAYQGGCDFQNWSDAAALYQSWPEPVEHEEQVDEGAGVRAEAERRFVFLATELDASALELVPDLCWAVGNHLRCYEAARTAVKLLGKLRELSAVSILTAGLHDARLAQDAAWALARIEEGSANLPPKCSTTDPTQRAATGYPDILPHARTAINVSCKTHNACVKLAALCACRVKHLFVKARWGDQSQERLLSSAIDLAEQFAQGNSIDSKWAVLAAKGAESAATSALDRARKEAVHTARSTDETSWAAASAAAYAAITIETREALFNTMDCVALAIGEAEAFNHITRDEQRTLVREIEEGIHTFIHT